MKIYVRMNGSYGNNLFCYAFGYALAKEKSADLVIDTFLQDYGFERPFELESLQIPQIRRMSWKHIKYLKFLRFLTPLLRIVRTGFSNEFREKAATVYDSNVFNVIENTYFVGFWESEKYFQKYRNDITDIFQPKKVSLETALLADKMSAQNSVSIHVRRGDYVSLDRAIPMNYYDIAIKYLLASEKKAVFYIFSDDIHFCEVYFSKFRDLDVVFPKIKMENPVIEDVYLMSQCKHNIIANSTYSWWGAWLNRNTSKIVICPDVGIWTGDFYPDEWTKIKI